MSLCGDISTLTLHQQCFLDAEDVPAFEQLVTRVDGGWIYQKLVVTPIGPQAREGSFVAEEGPPNLYIASNVFDMALNTEAIIAEATMPEVDFTLTPGTDAPAYGFVVRAVEDGWNYHPAWYSILGWQMRGPIFVPRAKYWNEQTYTADGTTSLTLSGQVAPTTNIADKIEVWVGNGARRTYSATPTALEHFGVTGTTQIDWPTDDQPRSGEFVTVKTLENVST